MMPAPTVGPPSVSQVPLRVGLYMNPRFRNYLNYESHIISLGEGLTSGAEMALRKVFKEVVVVNETDSDMSSQDIRAIISPEIVDSQIGGLFPPSRSRIVCKWTITGADGKIYYLNTITGVGVDSSFVGATRISRSMMFAAGDMFEKFLTHMLATKWWEHIR